MCQKVQIIGRKIMILKKHTKKIEKYKKHKKTYKNTKQN